MSSYHSSFNYNGENSAKKNLIIIEFEPNDGFMDTFLSMDNVSDDYYDGTKRFDYGSKYNKSAEIKITLIKNDGTDMSLNEFRSYAKWLTGARINSWIEMYSGNTHVYDFLGKFTNLEQYKMDGRTIGIRLTLSSVTPWAFSAPQNFSCSIGQLLDITDDGHLIKKGNDNVPFGFNDGILSVDAGYPNSAFNIRDDGTLYLNNAWDETIYNESDDLYTYIYLDIDYINENGTYVSIKNNTIGEESRLNNVKENENIFISAKQFIMSYIKKDDGSKENTNRIFGDDFNFVWPRLAPGNNDFVVDGNGVGTAYFTYRYPMKVGDCTMDISTYGGGMDCGDCDGVVSYDTVRWQDIVGAPTTIEGYGITNAYTSSEIDEKMENIDVEWKDVTNTPTTVSGYGITDAYTTSDVYTKTEVDDKIDDIEISGGTGGGSVVIDEEELNNMLNDILK